MVASLAYRVSRLLTWIGMRTNSARFWEMGGALEEWSDCYHYSHEPAVNFDTRRVGGVRYIRIGCITLTVSVSHRFRHIKGSRRHLRFISR